MDLDYSFGYSPSASESKHNSPRASHHPFRNYEELLNYAEWLQRKATDILENVRTGGLSVQNHISNDIFIK